MKQTDKKLTEFTYSQNLITYKLRRCVWQPKYRAHVSFSLIMQVKFSTHKKWSHARTEHTFYSNQFHFAVNKLF